MKYQFESPEWKSAQAAFNAAYWASQHPSVRTLNNLEGQQRFGEAMRLATSGFSIDLEIHAMGNDPYTKMVLREDYGFTWIPNILQPRTEMAPGYGTFGTLQAYDPKNPLAGSIPVSSDPAAYPAFPEAKPPAPKPADKSPVGELNYGNVYFSQPWDDEPNGKEIEIAGRGKFRKRATWLAEWWEKVA